MFYQQHVFICTNQKADGKKCCANADSVALAQYAKARCKEAGLTAHNRVRVSSSGCLGRCEAGPCLLIYPSGRWYTYRSQADIDAIIEGELLEQVSVPELLLPESAA